jgi:aminopeptidase C
MKRTIILLTILAMAGVNANAQDKKPADEQALRFTTIKENAITPVKNQNRSGTCWAYASMGYFESEILRKTGKTYDLSEMFVANKDYMDCAVYHVRMQGSSRFSEGGSVTDALEVARNYGLCPETAMAAPGSLTGDSLANFTEFFSLLEPYVASVVKSSEKKISPQWKQGMQGILDAYLGECPQSFVYEGKTYTPKTFAQSLGLDFDDYISVTSFTHHPFHTRFAIEAPYKWRHSLSYNVPMDEMMRIIDDALEAGYTVAWGGDVSEDGFTRTGIALACDLKRVQDLTGSDAARWLRLTSTEKGSQLKKLGAGVPEITPTQERRQERFDSHEMTYDHVMLIYGTARDQNGREYYMVKNSWGQTGDHAGIWYMSKNYIADNTIYVVINKHALRQPLQAR